MSLDLPYYSQEFSNYSPSQVLPYNLDDASVSRADAVGDLGLDWRHLLLGQPHGPGRLGSDLQLSFPTGQGPFASASTLVATGSGAFGASLGLMAEAQWATLLAWLQGSGTYDFGRSVNVSPGSFVAFLDDGSALVLAGGRTYAQRGLSYAVTAGLGWTWFQDKDSEHRLAVEARASQLGPLYFDAKEVPLSGSARLELAPEARFSFSNGFSLNAAWDLPVWGFTNLVTNQAVAYYGEILVRVDIQR